MLEKREHDQRGGLDQAQDLSRRQNFGGGEPAVRGSMRKDHAESVARLGGGVWPGLGWGMVTARRITWRARDIVSGMDDAARPSLKQADAIEAEGDVLTGSQAAVSERERQWQRDNRDAIACYNEWTETYGVTLEEFRLF